MNEMYWVTRLDAVNDFLIVLIILATIAIVGCLIILFSEIVD